MILAAAAAAVSLAACGEPEPVKPPPNFKPGPQLDKARTAAQQWSGETAQPAPQP